MLRATQGRIIHHSRGVGSSARFVLYPMSQALGEPSRSYEQHERQSQRSVHTRLARGQIWERLPFDGNVAQACRTHALTLEGV